MDNILISVVIVVRDQAELIEQNLPLFLGAAEETQAEVIVVEDTSTDEVHDMLQLMRSNAPRLYTTFLPRTIVMGQSHQQMALSIGVKAAKGNYIVMADIQRPPCSSEWLKGLADGEAAVVFCKPKKQEVTHLVASDPEDLKAMILKAERKSGQGHNGRRLKMRRGLYDAVAVKKLYAFDTIRLFDQRIGLWRLAWLRLCVWLRF